METNTDEQARLRIEPDGELMFWLYIDGKITDLIMLSELRTIKGISQDTIHGIDQIYDDLKQAKESEEE